jgi:hypothetical protein
MSASIDSDQALLEIEHALAKRFQSPSTAVTHTTLSSGVLTVQMSWVVAPATMNILDERCVLNVAFAPDVLGRYMSLKGADRVGFRQRLCTRVSDEVRRHVPQGANEIVDCNLTVEVDASMV